MYAGTRRLTTKRVSHVLGKYLITLKKQELDDHSNIEGVQLLFFHLSSRITIFYRYNNKCYTKVTNEHFERTGEG
ncbi:hypothetical protein APU01nite_12260 [Alkalibacterium putridalgicola]|uniref:Phage integrase family protein n=1 Tax=Alkalibacterium putridalgicola TaxID=426703 RepID=A0ABQ0UXP6_9LACT|nr:hypothetical protein APU01nite_12260 [Alkalibacterium putridalgicola]